MLGQFENSWRNKDFRLLDITTPSKETPGISRFGLKMFLQSFSLKIQKKTIFSLFQGIPDSENNVIFFESLLHRHL